MNELIKKYHTNFNYFFGHLRYRILLMMALNIIVGVLDGLGLSMFLPLLQLVSGDSRFSPEGLGNLDFIIDILRFVAIPFTLVGVLLFMTMFFVLKGIVVFIQGSYESYVQQFFVRNIRLENINNLNALSFKAFLRSDVGEIQNTLSGEVDRVARAFGSYFMAVQQMILVSVYIAFALMVDIQFALLVCVGGGLTNFLFRTIYKHTKGQSRTLTNYTNSFQGLIIQYVGNFKYLKATGSLVSYSKKLAKMVYQIESSNKRIGVLTASLKGLREPLIIIVVSTVILVQVTMLGSPLGPILVSLLFFYRALTALMAMQTAWNYFLGTSGSLSHMASFSADLKSGRERKGTLSVCASFEKLQLKNAFLSYNARSVLSNINIEIRRNETVAFVGESGSGKTTLVSVLAGLMPLDKGELLINGHDRDTICLEGFQKRLGYITQDPVVFNDTIFNNVTFWADPTPANVERFQEAMEIALLGDFLNTNTNREHSLLGNDGINLSGGQKQRLAIARELFKDIDILILDEATAALDSQTEKAIQDNIDSLKGKRTILIVAHRLSAVRNADRVVFMQDGQIINDGSFSETVKKVPGFQRMVALQTV